MNATPSRRELLEAAVAAATPLFLSRALLAAGAQDKATAFAPKIGVCTSVSNAAVLRQAGADYLEVGVGAVLVPDKPDEAFAENLKAAKDCGLPIVAANGFLPETLKSTGPQANHDGVLKYAETAFKRARQVGIKVIVFGSAGSRTLPDGFDRDEAKRQFVALLKRMGPLAQPHEVVVAVEPLQKQETNFINTLAEGAEIVRAADHPNIRLLADVFHMLRMDEPPEPIRQAGKLLAHVHLAEKRERTPPGVDGDDFSGYLQALKDIGYTGCVSIECGWQDLAKQLPPAIKMLREQMGKGK